MDSVKINFKKAFFLPPASKLQFGYLFSYDISFPDGRMESKSIAVYASDILTMIWGLDFYKIGDRSAEKILFQYAKKKIVEKFKEGTLNDSEEVVLITSQNPPNSPYNPSSLSLPEEDELIIEPESKTLNEEIKDNKLAAAIIEKRDIINAIFKAKHSEKLLLLDQERNLLDFFKTAKTEEEYSHRIASLGQVSRSINADVLNKILIDPDPKLGSIAVLRKFLESIGKTDTSISDILKNIGYIRKGYPIHLDIKDVLEGYKYFGLKYPVVDFENTWTTLLNQYLFALNQLYENFAEVYSV
ncbi:MAG: hypothetical protein IPJ81_16840 [Chitinophagaceae bacterium]|nr:hypothetical protein [Chitinophagaceae bacterium]